MITYRNESDIEQIFKQDAAYLKNVYVKMNETALCDPYSALHVDLGSCISCVLAGMDENKDVWIAANHLFKSRTENDDISLFQIAALIDSLSQKGIVKICCLGLFGGGYNENSPAGKIARKNVLSSLETISIYDMHVAIFETGYRQSLSMYASQKRQSVLLRHKNMMTNELVYYEFPYIDYF